MRPPSPSSHPAVEATELRITITLGGAPATMPVALLTASTEGDGHYCPGCDVQRAALHVTALELLDLAAGTGRCAGCAAELANPGQLRAAQILHGLD